MALKSQQPDPPTTRTAEVVDGDGLLFFNAEGPRSEFSDKPQADRAPCRPT
jgi:hypothetical protein